MQKAFKLLGLAAKSNDLSNGKNEGKDSADSVYKKVRPSYCLPPGKRLERGRERSLQESLNNKVDLLNPPPVPTTAPKWQAARKAILAGKEDSSRTEHEQEVRANFEGLKIKRRVALGPEQKAQEEKEKAVRMWQYKVAEESPEEVGKLAGNSSQEEKRLLHQEGEKLDASSKTGSRISRPNRVDAALRSRIQEDRSRGPKKAISTSDSSKETSAGSATRQAGSSSRAKGSQQAAESSRRSNAPSSPRHARKSSNSQSRLRSRRDSIASTSTASSKAEVAVHRESARNTRSSIKPGKSTSAATSLPGAASKKEITLLQQPSQGFRSTKISRRPEQPHSQSSGQQPRSEAQGKSISASNTKDGNSSQGSSRVSTVRNTEKQSSQTKTDDGNSNQTSCAVSTLRNTPKQSLQASQLRRVTNASGAESASSTQRQSAESQDMRDKTKSQGTSQATSRSLYPSKQPQTTQSSTSGVSKPQKQQSQPTKRTSMTQQSQFRAILTPMIGGNAKYTTRAYDFESEAAFEPQTVFYRGPGDNRRTVIEGLVPLSPTDMAIRARRIEQESQIRTPGSQAGPGDSTRTILEATQPMTSEDIKDDQRRRQSAAKKQEEATYVELPHSEFNRGVGDMTRYVFHTQKLAKRSYTAFIWPIS
ncbi:uncharacterized protein RSE6_00979 [Rhynchosporium secalis]|uniref:Uncharacterized protein n=1 Tax=Rhynchosporium secalis TaxID=38038 RepID=A0A1E1LWM2_RHYSE|nr:uncharacterized protein RSE6_00979 [Rhynchosporium secalis]